MPPATELNDGGDSWAIFSQQATRIDVSVGRPQRQHFVQRQPQTVNVAAPSGLSLEPFRRHVAERADNISRPADGISFDRLRETEIGYPNDASAIENQIGRLDIAVQHLSPVRIVERLGDLDADPRDVPPIGGRNPNRQAARIGLQYRHRLLDGRIDLRRRGEANPIGVGLDTARRERRTVARIGDVLQVLIDHHADGGRQFTGLRGREACVLAFVRFGRGA